MGSTFVVKVWRTFAHSGEFGWEEVYRGEDEEQAFEVLRKMKDVWSLVVLEWRP